MKIEIFGGVTANGHAYEDNEIATLRYNNLIQEYGTTWFYGYVEDKCGPDDGDILVKTELTEKVFTGPRGLPDCILYLRDLMG